MDSLQGLEAGTAQPTSRIAISGLAWMGAAKARLENSFDLLSCMIFVDVIGSMKKLIVSQIPLRISLMALILHVLKDFINVLPSRICMSCSGCH